jgi:hypothetical protein
MKRQRENAQTAQSSKKRSRPTVKVLRPKACEIASQQKDFVKALRTNGGNVSAALEVSGLARRTAYDRYANDQQFAEDWAAAVEESVDELYVEARRRALGHDNRPSSSKRLAKGEKPSDRLLIFLLQRGEYRKRWRTRIIKVGQLAYDAVRDYGSRIGMSESQIRELQDALIEEFNKVPVN